MPRPTCLALCRATVVNSRPWRRLLGGGGGTTRCGCHLSAAAVERAREGKGGPPPSTRLKFDDHREVFSHKTSWELLRGLLVLRICGTDFVADSALKLFRLGHRLLGERALGWFLRPTIYAQFVAAGRRKGGGGSARGQDRNQRQGRRLPDPSVSSRAHRQMSEEAREGLEAAAGSLEDLGLRLMVAPTLEGDVGEGGRDDLYDRNLQELLQLGVWAWDFGGGEFKRRPCLQVKATALLSADVLKILAKLFQESSESEKIKLVDLLAQSALNTSATPAAWSGITGLNRDINDAIYKGARRLGDLGVAAKRKGLTLLVDAEYSYVNDAVSLLTLAAMHVYNKDLPIICSTIQCYFKEAKSNLDREIKIAEALSVCYGAKIVRGAYLEQERSIAPNKNKLPTCSSHEETGQNYKRVISHFMEYAASRQPGKSLVVVATHNERGICHAVDTLHSLKISPLDGRIVFAQIYGMAEQISMPLVVVHHSSFNPISVRGGYIVYKSVPVGGLAQVLPYLARRAAENRSVLLGARKERELLQSELLWRLKG